MFFLTCTHIHAHTHNVFFKIILCAWPALASPITLPFSNLPSAAPPCPSQNKHNLHSEQDPSQVEWSYFGWVIENTVQNLSSLTRNAFFKIKPKWTRLGKFEGGQNGERAGFLPDSDKILLNHSWLFFTFNSTNFFTITNQIVQDIKTGTLFQSALGC